MLPNPSIQIHRYSIDFNPKEENRRKKRRLVELLIASHNVLRGPGIATDFANTILTVNPLPLGSEPFKVFEQKYFEKEDGEPDDKSKSYRIKVEKDGTVAVQELLNSLNSASPNLNFDKAATIQALNIIITGTANETPKIYGGGRKNKFFVYPQQQNDWFSLGEGLIALKGFYTSVRTSTLRLLVNIQVCNSAFYPPTNLLGLMRVHTPNIANDGRSGLEGFISKLKVSHTYLRKRKNDPKSYIKKVKTVQGFSHTDKHKFQRGTAVQLKFPCPELKAKGNISVEEFFLKRHGIRLAHPREPCVNLGTKDNPVWVPPELLTVEEGQQYNHKLSDQQTAKMIEFAVRKPAENARRIVAQGAPLMGLNPNCDRIVCSCLHRLGGIVC